ncbi:CLUMA_CG016745, isoform A [Clunio marinus]|uniref:CLUMA_CG016745, isoform A n=1 Tax=Clunio marinus TaxID=568069 RepID=A0A1J1ITT6_9DIPT|nr:CLUMA_CG016745, isoform A [Clunio marinus]
MIVKSSVVLIVVTFVSTGEVLFTKLRQHHKKECEPVPGCTDNGVFYPVGASVPQKNPCKTCYCAENGLECAEIACDAPPPGCVTQNNPDQCCPEILYCGCEVDGAIIKIGEESPDNTPCTNCTCVESDNGPNLSCVVHDCSPTPPGCVTRNNPDQCCPEILYCGCEVDGTIYKVDEEIADNDPCLTCACVARDTVSCNDMSCDAPPPGCVTQNVPGQCCPEILYCGCEVDGAIIKIGEESPNNTPCFNCTCLAYDKGPKLSCVVTDCDLEGELRGCVTQDVPGQCCPDVLYCGCYDDDGTVYKIGDDVPNKDPCVTCACEARGPVSCYYNSCLALAPPPGCENAQPSPGACCPDYQALGCETV